MAAIYLDSVQKFSSEFAVCSASDSLKIPNRKSFWKNK
jgi:hypothetical protein